MEKTNILSDSNRIGLKSLNNHCFDMKQIFVQLQNSSDDAEPEKKNMSKHSIQSICALAYECKNQPGCLVVK